MYNRPTLSEEESSAYLNHLSNLLYKYANSKKGSGLRVSSANSLCGFLKDTLPRASYKWKHSYLKLIKEFTPALVSNRLAIHSAPNLLEREVKRSKICFEADERD